MDRRSKPNVAVNLLTIHKVITRALSVSIEKTRDYSQHGLPDETMQNGFSNFIRTLISVLLSHQRTEDYLAFPYSKYRLPVTPFDMLGQQHEEMAGILEEARYVIVKIDNGPGTEKELESILLALNKANEIWL